MELLNVAVPGDQEVTIGQIVTPVGLVAFPWEQYIGGEKRWGVAFRAEKLAIAAAARPVPVPSAESSASADVA
ncbi:hypothetical protein Acsp03_22950 [Actinomadura sp. NBRC 104412]|uniref:hypothetical protein n=1 Tax=Actinomadura sp. NBRC 104412 TaxID=3032203 RepID=UPI0024A3B1F9|nr:hypothetical protein [Actinomadura sp. NBRC 104412]GLZ04829.1 hypothetical protein Acsp03_22950 [Actinomadura sp. NBRC 104412]